MANKTILAVDDSATILQTIRVTLETVGYNVVTAINGKEGLEVLGKEEKVYTILTDLNMPVMDGITFIQKVRELPNYKFVPIIMLTTESQGIKKNEAKKAGASGWIVKPFKPEQVLTVIKRICP